MSVDDIDELFMLLSLLVADLSVPVELLFMLPPAPVVEGDVMPLVVPMFDEPVLEPLTDPVERVVLLLVVPVAVFARLPAFGPEFMVSLLGAPEAPP